MKPSLLWLIIAFLFGFAVVYTGFDAGRPMVGIFLLASLVAMVFEHLDGSRYRKAAPDRWYVVYNEYANVYYYGPDPVNVYYYGPDLVTGRVSLFRQEIRMAKRFDTVDEAVEVVKRGRIAEPGGLWDGSFQIVPVSDGPAVETIPHVPVKLAG